MGNEGRARPPGGGDTGAVATEYVLVATLIALLIISGASVIGERVRDFLDAAANLI